MQEGKKSKVDKMLRQRIRRMRHNENGLNSQLSSASVVFDPDFVTEMSFRKLKKLKKLSVQRVEEFKARGSHSVQRSLLDEKVNPRFLGGESLEKPLQNASHFKIRDVEFEKKFKQSENIAKLISQLKQELNLQDDNEKKKLSYREFQRKRSKKLKNLRIGARRSEHGEQPLKIIFSPNNPTAKFFEKNPTDADGANSPVKVQDGKNDDLGSAFKNKKRLQIDLNSYDKKQCKRNSCATSTTKITPKSLKVSSSKANITPNGSSQLVLTSRNISNNCILPSMPALKSTKSTQKPLLPQNSSEKKDLGLENTYVVKRIFEASNVAAFMSSKKKFQRPFMNMRNSVNLFTKFERYKKDIRHQQQDKEKDPIEITPVKQPFCKRSPPKFVVNATKTKVEIKMQLPSV
ncbi:unnamed protein product [Moneuplotes crassus]|uniref:Uncharacterized protein n=1 Tax=Euplotes crassus TaxID=5936 RepID=A0AAD1UAG1_EUPCR|nr:unnamed protein product [Moneuplotes crassus]